MLLVTTPSSLILNYLGVAALTLLGWYTHTVVIWGVFLPELILLGLLLKRHWGKIQFPQSAIVSLDGASWAFFLLVATYLVGAVDQVGTVFTANDAVASWDRWAEDWFRGVQPQATNYYPQLVPTLYSLTYQFMGGASIKLFARLVPLIFALSSLTIGWRLAQLIPGYRSQILWAWVLFAALFHRLNGDLSQFNGYADFPLVYFSAVSAWCFTLLHQNAAPKHHERLFILSALLISAAAVTKQSGMWLVLIFPFFWYWIIARNRFEASVIIRLLLKGCLISMLVAISWYGYKYVQIHTGGDSSNIQQLAELVPVDKSQRVPYAFNMLTGHLTLPFSLILSLLLLAGMRDRLARGVQIAVGLPMLFFWAYFVPYDFRNLALAILPLSFGITVGAGILISSINRYVQLRWLGMAVAGLLAASLSVQLTSPKVDKKLYEKAEQESRKIGENPLFNQKLYTYFELHSESGRVLTVDVTARWLPTLNQRMRLLSCDELLPEWEKDKDAQWLVTAHYCSKAVFAGIAQKEKQGELRLLFHQKAGDWRFYERVRTQ